MLEFDPDGRGLSPVLGFGSPQAFIDLKDRRRGSSRKQTFAKFERCGRAGVELKPIAKQFG